MSSSSILGPPSNVQRALGNKGWTVNDVRALLKPEYRELDRFYPY